MLSEKTRMRTHAWEQTDGNVWEQIMQHQTIPSGWDMATMVMDKTYGTIQDDVSNIVEQELRLEYEK